MRALISLGCTGLGVERVFVHAATVITASWRVQEKWIAPAFLEALACRM